SGPRLGREGEAVAERADGIPQSVVALQQRHAEGGQSCASAALQLSQRGACEVRGISKQSPGGAVGEAEFVGCGPQRGIALQGAQEVQDAGVQATCIRTLGPPGDVSL